MNGDLKEKGFTYPKLGIGLAVGALVIVIIMLTVRSITFSEKDESKAYKNNQTEVVLEEDSSTSANEDKDKNEETPLVEGEKEASTDTNKSNENTDNQDENNTSTGANTSDESNSQSNTLQVVEVPELGEIKESSVLVSGKTAYMLDDVYTYSLSLIFPDGDNYDIVKYMCSKKTYDGVNQGETVNVTYQTDENGIISISSISK